MKKLILVFSVLLLLMSAGAVHASSDIKVVINMSTDPATFSAEIYLDGKLVATSTNFYGSEKPDAKPVVSNGMVDIRVQRRVIYKAYIDNVIIDFSEK